MNKPQIILVARINRKLQPINPEQFAELDIDRTFPMFLSRDGKYYTVPGYETQDVLDKWLVSFIQ